jgi:hypothetical protein
MSVFDAAQQTRVDTLRAMRDRLALAMDEAEASVVAQVAARLQAVLKELDELAEPLEVSPLDDLARRREARESGADDAPRTRRRRPRTG